MPEEDFEDEFGNDDDDQGIDPGKLKGLRQAARTGSKAIKENGTLKSDNDLLRLENALYKAGLNGLSEIQQSALFGAHKGEGTPDALKTTAIALGFIEAPKDTDTEDQSKFVDAAKGGQVVADGTIKPEDVAKWPEEKRREFLTSNPDAFKALMRGESVRV